MHARVPLLVCVLSLLFSACHDRGGEIVDVRTFAPLAPPAFREVPLADRLGFRPRREANEAPQQPLFAYDLPQGWQQLEPMGVFRLVNLRPAGHAETECFVSFLSGSGGGIEANLDRWRGQLGLPPMAAGEIDRLETIPMFGQQARLFLGEGEYSGMSETKKPNWKMAAAFLARADGAITVKLTGPKAVVDQELGRFRALVASLRLNTAAASRPASAPAGTPPAGVATSSVRWTKPESWETQAEQPMRLVSFRPRNAPATECWISLAMGDLAANVNRWRSMLGLAPIGSKEIEELPRIEVLGQPSLLVDLTGSYTGRDGKTIANARFLGVVCTRGDESVFVRMTGPADEVGREHANFLALLRSLR